MEKHNFSIFKKILSEFFGRIKLSKDLEIYLLYYYRDFEVIFLVLSVNIDNFYCTGMR